ncbi:MAG: Cation transporter [Ignavibacteria bacterium]|nr:Cation transporter [Ignavibacteria bacterium]
MNTDNIQIENKEKRTVALSSIAAAVLLTVTKFVVGITTGSLGILSEALHSGLDLVAAVMTYFAVKFADRPPDKDHNWGHGKIENLSALGETVLLFITCIWIIYEGVMRLSTGRTEITVNVWAFAVIILSIIVDISRSRALMKVAKKYDSQALEADALHFSTDILSSSVVLSGLIGAAFNSHFADSIAALLVAVIVIKICYKIGKKSIDALLDKSSAELLEKVSVLAMEIPDVKNVHDIRQRNSGSQNFIEMNIHVSPNLTIEKAHEISHLVEEHIKATFKRSHVHVHTEPDEN